MCVRGDLVGLARPRVMSRISVMFPMPLNDARARQVDQVKTKHVVKQNGWRPKALPRALTAVTVSVLVHEVRTRETDAWKMHSQQSCKN